jgi:hypothetical protein
VRRRKPIDVEDAIEKAKLYSEEIDVHKPPMKKTKRDMTGGQDQPFNDSEWMNSSTTPISNTNRGNRTAFDMTGDGQSTSNNRNFPQKVDQRPSGSSTVSGDGGREHDQIKCFKCSESGHIQRFCPKFGLVCFSCGGLGHRKIDCPSHGMYNRKAQKENYISALKLINFSNIDQKN